MANAASEARSQVFFMLISAGLFAYFGFTTTWIYTGVNGEFLLFVALLEWTLKGAAIGFALSLVVTFIQPVIGGLIYSVVGLVSAVLFLVVALLDTLDQQHTAMPPFLLVIFAVWNGYGSFTGLQEFLATRRSAAGPA